MEHTQYVIPVLVVGQGMTVLGVLRSLGKYQVPTYCVLPATDFVAHSNYYRSLPREYGETTDLDDLPNLLERLRFPKAVLIPCSDHAVRAVAELDARFRERYAASLPPASSVRLLHDKGAFSELLQQTGVPHPHTILIGSAAALEAMPDEQFVNAFLKPRDSQAFSRRFKRKAFRVHNRSEAVDRWHEISEAGLSVVLQNYIPGPADRHYFIDGFIDRNGVTRARFARQRWRIYPPDFGDSSYMVSIPLDRLASAVESLDKIFAAVPYRGVFSAEFKWDERDDQYKILEVNTRPWWYNAFAAWCGVDTTMMAYRDALDMEVPTVTTYAVGKRMAFFLNDFPACRKLYRERKLTAGQWLRSWLTARPAVFQLDDPLPSLYQWRNVLINKLARFKILEKKV